MGRLAVLPKETILELLTDDAVFQLAKKYVEFEATTEADNVAAVEVAETPAPTQPAKVNERAKRPLNAFMAFRSYYVKLFPDIQQKTASGFLTTLWHKDPFRNKWALIAKVYSFARDQIGKDKISLAYFLSLACPTMKVPEPSSYLALLGWSVEEDNAGSQKLIQNEPSGSLDQCNISSDDVPSTELDLLSTLITVGFVPAQGVDLLERMGTNQNGMMTTDGVKYTLPVSYTPEKINFISKVRRNPIKAAKLLIGDNHALPFLDAESYNVHNVDLIGHLPLQRRYQDPRLHYNYSTNLSGMDVDPNEPVLDFNTLPQNDSFDISSPYDIDEMLGYTQMEGERTAHLPQSLRYNQLEDFHYTY
ncbi:hypothetical protein XA68_13739 [Ophiocordyceps unilateralis]|uniref:Alpha box domain-containing protein n=1 Tax=Ophiocordyceps unilateralis TaxID=268505 RepID=A0A2A9PA31_OPHUN|nr:hypothetical protein XA68_13739 [Ophiocordyceps unilateralis]